MIVLKPGKEKFIYLKNPWIFSGAVATYPEGFVNGEVYPVASAKGERLGFAYFNRNTSLCGRMVSFGGVAAEEAIRGHLAQAVELRRALYRETTAYRLVNAEGDGLPGLIVDRYGPYFVLQVGTLGMEKLKPLIVNELIKLSPLGIYEKSTAASRAEEGLNPIEQTLWGTIPEEIKVCEGSVKFWVDVKKGQKTGFFLDQKEMRSLIGSLSKNKRVLNCFAYTGGFSLFALQDGAREVTSVDCSAEAVEMMRKNTLLNDFPLEKHHLLTADVFRFLRESPELAYDIVILDPPAFAKKKADTEQALRGYREINLQALFKMPVGSLLLTCSCSYHIDDESFRKMLFECAKTARREVQIISAHRQSLDHPINIYHRESEYLKSYLLYIARKW